MIDRREWVFETHTYDRATDTWKVYYNGEYFGNATNNKGDSNWSTGEDATKVDYFGKVSDKVDNRIAFLSVGCRADSTVSNIWTVRGGLDDLAIYNGVLTHAEIKAVYDNTNAFDSSADLCLLLYYDFNDPTSNTVLKQAPSTSGLYPMILGATRLTAEVMSASHCVEDTCSVSTCLPPVFNCHTASMCSSISASSKAPIANPDAQR